MNYLRTFLFSALAGCFGVAHASTLEVEVNGLVCAFCAQGIEKTLRTFDATDDVFVSLEDRLVAVALKDGGDIAEADLRKAITDAGYAVVAVHRSDESLADVRARVGTHDD